MEENHIGYYLFVIPDLQLHHQQLWERKVYKSFFQNTFQDRYSNSVLISTQTIDITEITMALLLRPAHLERWCGKYRWLFVHNLDLLRFGKVQRYLKGHFSIFCVVMCVGLNG